jgi:hypothetical protein
MKSRGVVFTADVADHGYGLVTYFKAPGGIQVQLYEPRYVKGPSGSASKPAKKKAASKASTRSKSKPRTKTTRTSPRRKARASR